MDLTDATAPRSDQMNSDDLVSGPRTFTITEVRRGNDEQPVNVYLTEFPAGRPFKPSKSMLRVMIAAWGKESDAYAGKRLTLYRDPSIRFGKDVTGGIRISHMSDLPKRLTIALTITRGKRAPYIVEPLPDAAPVSPAIAAETLAALEAAFEQKGIPLDARLSGANHITGGAVNALESLTEAAGQQVLAALAQRPDVVEGAPNE